MGIIRFLLAVCVLLWHCPAGVVPRFLFPTLAVQCFYIVSGFLIQMVLLERYSGGTGWARQFYLSRFLRIYPLYALFAVLTGACFGLELTHYLHQGDLLAAVLWLENNLLVIGQDVLRFFYFDLGDGHFGVLPANGTARALLLQHVSVGGMTILPQSWTLAIEMYFYLLAPFILLRRTRTLLCVLALCVALRFTIGAHFPSRPELVYGFFPTELALFLAGSLSYRLYKHMGDGHAFTQRYSLIATTGVVLGVATVYLNSVPDFLSERTAHTFPLLFGAWGEQPLGVPPDYWVIVLLTALALPFAFHFSKRFAFDRYLGELSYPIYISHFLVLQLVTAQLNPPASATPFVGLTVLVITLLLSIVLVDYCEEPLARLRHRLTAREQPRL